MIVFKRRFMCEVVSCFLSLNLGVKAR